MTLGTSPGGVLVRALPHRGFCSVDVISRLGGGRGGLVAGVWGSWRKMQRKSQGLINVLFLGSLNITSKYLLEITSPIVGWVMFNCDIYQPLKQWNKWIFYVADGKNWEQNIGCKPSQAGILRLLVSEELVAHLQWGDSELWNSLNLYSKGLSINMYYNHSLLGLILTQMFVHEVEKSQIYACLRPRWPVLLLLGGMPIGRHGVCEGKGGSK